MMLRIRYLTNQLVAQRANKESKKSYKEEISLTFKYGEVVPLKRPKVIFGINPYKAEYNEDKSDNKEERCRKVLFKIIFDSLAYIDGKCDNLFVPFFFSSKINQEVWYHLVYKSVSRYLQINYESKIKCVCFYYSSSEFEERKDELDNLYQYLDTIDSVVEIQKEHIKSAKIDDNEDIEEVNEEGEDEGEESESESESESDNKHGKRNRGRSTSSDRKERKKDSKKEKSKNNKGKKGKDSEEKEKKKSKGKSRDKEEDHKKNKKESNKRRKHKSSESEDSEDSEDKGSEHSSETD